MHMIYFIEIKKRHKNFDGDSSLCSVNQREPATVRCRYLPHSMNITPEFQTERIQVGFDGIPPLAGRHKIVYAYQVVSGLFTPSCMGGVILFTEVKHYV